MQTDNPCGVPTPTDNIQDIEGGPQKELTMFEKDGKTYIRLYLFMRAEHLSSVFTNDALKVVLPEECNDPMEFTVAHSEKPQEKLLEPIGMLCFSADYKNSAMWGHYADSHKGVCLEFEFKATAFGPNPCYLLDWDKNSLVLSLPLRKSKEYPCEKFFDAILWPVHYTDTRPTRSGFAHLFEASINQPYPEDMDKIFNGPKGINYEELISDIKISEIVLTKPKHWQYEDEYRIFVYLGKDCIVRDNKFFVTGLTKYIRRIILGVNCELGDRCASMLSAIFQEKQENPTLPKIVQAHYHEDKYEIMID